MGTTSRGIVRGLGKHPWAGKQGSGGPGKGQTADRRGVLEKRRKALYTGDIA